MSDKYLKKKLPSVLTPALKAFFYFVLILAAFLLANSLYLLIYRFAENAGWSFFAFSETSLPKLFQVMLLSHTGIGILLTLILIAFVIAHLPKVWRRRHKTSIISGIIYISAGLILLITGLFIFTEAASRNNQWAWWVHVFCGLLVVFGHLTHRLVSYTRPSKINMIKYFVGILVITFVIVLGHSFSKPDNAYSKEFQREKSNENHDESGAFKQVNDTYPDLMTRKGFVSPLSPFFPSAVTTSSGGFLMSRIITHNDTGSVNQLTQDIHKNGFAQETAIGSQTCNRCHQDIVVQWSASAHRFASFNNPFYEATVMDMRKNSGKTNEWINDHVKHFPDVQNKVALVKSKWCGACHDPSIMLSGKMTDQIDRTKPESQAGLTCLSCHAIDQIHNVTGNGNYNVEDQQEDPYLFADAESGTFASFLHDASVKAKPEVHKRRMLKPVFRTSEYCATCHKVSLQRPVNNYRWLRGQNEFDNWHDSGVALNASRTFYLPPFKRQCQDCHMPDEQAIRGDLAAKNGMVKSHRFLAVNTALPYLRGDEETIRRIEQFLQNEKLRVDIFAIKTANSNKTVMAPEKNLSALITGEKVTVDVVVRNKGVGHTFPGGTNDSNEGWLEFTIQDESGKILAISGFLDNKKHVDPQAHAFKALMVDSSSNPINRRNAQDIHSVVFANVIGPGTADIAHYEFTVPKEFSGKKLTLKARLLWRKFNQDYTEFAFNSNPEGFKKFSNMPVLPVTEIASSQLKIAVRSEENKSPADNPSNKEVEWIRYNDYGIGLFFEDDTRGAIQAFEQVELLQPNSIEGPLNLAKAYIKEGNIDKAYSYLQKCEQIKKGEARVAWVWGVVLQEDGQYDKAVSAYKRVLQQFPEDRATWRNIGRSYFLNQQYEQALQAYDQVLNIDPEDRIAHYHRMLSLKALGRENEYLQAKAAYEFYQVDESAKKVTRAYRLKNPGANLMTQAVRTHKLDIETD
jgi:tetratricopeptide (TPR) repeat protein